MTNQEYLDEIQRIVYFAKINKKKINRWEERFYNTYLKDKYRTRKQVVLWKRICDFILPKLWIRIEVDGPHHYTSSYKAYDKKWDRILFERYGYITLRVKDFDNERAEEIMEIISKVVWNNQERLLFIKEYIRCKDISTIKDEDLTINWKMTIDYYKELYKIKDKKARTIKEKKISIKKQKIIKEKSQSKISVDRSHFSSLWVNMLYKTFNSK